MNQFNNFNRKRPYTPTKWRKEDSDQEGDSQDFEEEEEDLKDLLALLKELLDECRKLNSALKSTQVPSMVL